MANAHYFHPSDNVAPNATLSTTGAVNSSYPIANATDFSFKNIANPFKLTGTLGNLILDWGAAQRVDSVVIWHNLAAGTAYTVQMNATNSWGTPTVNISGTAPAKRSNGYTVKLYHDLTAASGYTPAGLRYLRFNVPGVGSPATGGNDVPIGLKVLVYQFKRTMVRNIRWGWGRDITQTGIRMATDARVRWAYDLTSAPRVLKTSIPGTDADYAAMLAYVDACAGFVKVTTIVPDPRVNDPWVGYLSNGSPDIPSPSIEVFTMDAPYQFTNVNPLNLALEEITAGDPEWF
jgi:hypothetical protein